MRTGCFAGTVWPGTLNNLQSTCQHAALATNAALVDSLIPHAHSWIGDCSGCQARRCLQGLQVNQALSAIIGRGSRCGVHIAKVVIFAGCMQLAGSQQVHHPICEGRRGQVRAVVVARWRVSGVWGPKIHVCYCLESGLVNGNLPLHRMKDSSSATVVWMCNCAVDPASAAFNAEAAP
eukprot:1139617-Pelagomonas_calceolata.AAC.7